MNTEEFKQKLFEKNPNVEVLGEYVNSHTKIKVRCKICGYEYEDAPNHLYSRTCKNCRVIQKRENSKKEFIEKANKVHNNKYNYSQVNYINCDTKVTIICPVHGEFEQTPYKHLKGQRCSECGKKIRNRKSTTQFIEEARQIYGDRFDYSKVEYTSCIKEVCIICPEHGEFWQTPRVHLLGSCGCKKCAMKYVNDLKRKTTEQFIEEARKVHGDKYDYSAVKYKDAHSKILVICPEHGPFKQTPNSHLNGRGCPQCKLKNQSKLFQKLKNSFPNEKIKYEVGNDTLNWLENQRIDIYFPKHNIAVEYNGRQHYVAIEHFGGELGFKHREKLDELKRQKCKENNCHLFEIKYDYTEQDYDNLVKDINNIITQ